MCLGEKKKGKSWTNSRSQLSDGKLSGQGLSPLKTTAIKRRFLMGGFGGNRDHEIDLSNG